MAAPLPQCLAIIVCEGVIEDLRSRNKTIVNTFNRIFSAAFPVSQDRLTVFVSLTNGHGEQDLEIRFVREVGHEWEPVVSVSGKVILVLATP